MNESKDDKANMKDPDNDADWRQKVYKGRLKYWKRLIGKNRSHFNRRDKVPADGGITDFFWKQEYWNSKIGARIYGSLFACRRAFKNTTTHQASAFIA